MKTAFRAVALFTIYGAIGFGGDYAANLMGQEGMLLEDEVPVRHEAEPAFDVDVVVDVQPEVFVDVQVRHAGSERCSFSASHSAQIPARDVDRLFIDVGSGDLRVEGVEGADEIAVQAVACASQEAWLEELRMTVDERSDDEIALIAHYPENRSRSRGGNTARIDLVVTVPFGLSVSIDDSSGDIVVSGTGDLEIDDSSGSIDVVGIDGSVRIDDSSGNLEVVDVSGEVDLDDSSGSIDVRGVQGSVLVRDGSGGIDIAEVGQDVLIESDGSGSIEVNNVLGDFMVRSDGSGGIRHSDIGGQVNVPEDRRRRRRRGGR